jgi:hypothetical protein
LRTRSGQPLVQNKQGEMVPAVPLPFFARFIPRYQCTACSRRHFFKKNYLGHYAYAHILGME